MSKQKETASEKDANVAPEETSPIENPEVSTEAGALVENPDMSAEEPLLMRESVSDDFDQWEEELVAPLPPIYPTGPEELYPPAMEPFEFGNDLWYAERWQTQWYALWKEIVDLEGYILTRMQKAVKNTNGTRAGQRTNANVYLAFDSYDSSIKFELKPAHQKNSNATPKKPKAPKGKASASSEKNGDGAEFTLEFWLRCNSPMYTSIVHIGTITPEGAESDFLQLHLADTNVSIDIKNLEPDEESADVMDERLEILHDQVLEVGTWQHLALTVDAEGTYVLYCNGKKADWKTDLPPFSASQRDYLRIGGNSDGWSEHVHVDIRDLRIWSTARSKEEVYWDMSNPPSQEEKELVSYWTFNDGEGEVIDAWLGDSHGDLFGQGDFPVWKSDTEEQRQYMVLKHVELQDIARSLRDFAASSFAFFHAGFFTDSYTYPGEHYSDYQTPIESGPFDSDQQLNEFIQGRKEELRGLLEYGWHIAGSGGLDSELGQQVRPIFFTSEKYSPNFVLGALIDQSSHDLNLLQQIYYQRSVRSGSRAFNTFLIAEELGRLGLEPAKGNLLDERYRSVLCYLGNRTEVRLLPYHNSVLMGIPQSANGHSGMLFGSDLVKYPLNFTAIPHEIGHVVYRFGQFPLTNGKLPIHKLLKNRLMDRRYALQESDWRFNWLEELFADAYGCLIAGPISVLGFQIMLADGPPQHLRGHLGEHPTPVLRPLLQSQILRQVRTQYGNPIFPEAASLLDARWQRWVSKNWPQWVADKWLGYTDQTDVIRAALFEVEGNMMTGQEILDALQPLIDVVLLTLERVRPEDEKSTWTPGWEPRKDTEQLMGLYDAFVKFANVTATKALDPARGETPFGEDSTQASQTTQQLLNQFSGKGTAGWRTRSGGIDGLIEMILFESWSDEGGNGAMSS